MRSANYKIVEISNGCVVIQDVGPWDKHLTVTNDAENVVARLIKQRAIRAGERLFYIDSEGNKDELLIKDGKFDGFA